MQRAFDTVLAGLLGELSSRQLVPSSGRPVILLAVSGGIDSMCMAELFRCNGLDVGIAVAHCNFSLRGEESDSDEALVKAWAEKSGVGLHVKHFDTQGYAYQHGLSIEMAARELRYKWFAELCDGYGYSALAVAHNANDNVETLFLNLLRGTGIRGLSGMKPLSAAPFSSHPLFRPLLDFTRKQIEGYVFAHNVEYHDDRTNFETEYKRNKIRNLVFPVLEQINPSFIRTVSRDMTYFSQVEKLAEDYYAGHKDRFINGNRININELMACDSWEYLLYRALDGYGFQTAVIASLEELLKSGRTVSGKVFEAPGHLIVTTGTELIVKERTEPEDGSTRITLRRRGTLPASVTDVLDGMDNTMTVHGPGNYFFNGISFSVSEIGRKDLETLKVPSGVLLFDSAKLPFPFLCRRWEKGDWMIPLGMKGKKKISDLFTDLKYSLLDKSASVVLVNPGWRCGGDEGTRVAAVVGVRSDDATRVTDDTGKVLIIKIIE